MIVEFIGAPGAGKTTLLDQVAQRLDARAVDLGHSVALDLRGRRRPRAARIMDWGIAVARNPRLCVRLSAAALPHLEPLRLSFEVCRRDHVVRALARQGGVTLVDEGPVHRLSWLLASLQWDSEALSARHLARPDMAVYLEVDPELAVERVRQRGGLNPLLGMSPERALAMVGLYEQRAMTVLERLGLPVVTAEDPSRVATAIRNHSIRQSNP